MSKTWRVSVPVSITVEAVVDIDCDDLELLGLDPSALTDEELAEAVADDMGVNEYVGETLGIEMGKVNNDVSLHFPDSDCDGSSATVEVVE